jgi:methylamine--corrinoid protein Co-methyltransferase
MDILECSNRFNSGRAIAEEEFDLEFVYPKMVEVIKKYEIRYDPQRPVPDDDGLADRVFEAAVEFLSEVGIYCMDIQRVGRFEREEILESVKGDRPKCLFGEGDDAKVWKPRRPDDSDTPPWCNVGTGIISTTEELMMKRVEGYAAIGRADSMVIPALSKYKGSNISPGQPSEILGSIHDIKLAREAMQRAGRPGLAILNVVPTSGTVQGTIATSYPAFGTRLSDGWYVAVYPEFKVTLDMLSKIAFLKEIGANYASECSSILGGHVGGVEGVAVASAAYSVFATLIYDAGNQCKLSSSFEKYRHSMV